MQDLTPEGRRAVDDLAQRYGVSADAVTTLLHALVASNGSMAQFSHPELGGMGQWSQGGMTMVGDMFNQGLKARVDGLCSELSTLLRGQQPAFSGSFQSQSQSGSSGQGGVSLFVPATAGSSSSWWPAGLGWPGATGAQNDVRYAWFPSTRRLAIQLGGRVTVYDTGDHQVGGFAQQQGPDSSLTFTSQNGLIRVADLPLVPDAGAAPAPQQQQAWAPAAESAPDKPTWSPPAAETSPQQPSWSPPAALAQASVAPAGAVDDVIAKIERLADLRQKGILTDEEFAAKKGELLARL